MDLRQDPEENHAVLVGSGEIFCEGWIIGAIQKSSVSSQRGVMAIVLDEERRVQEEARAMWDLEVALFEGSALLMVICVHSSCNGLQILQSSPVKLCQVVYGGRSTR